MGLVVLTGHRAMGLSVAPIRMEAFLDLQCSDSKNAWGVIRELLDLYPTKIYFILHEFSLSYKEKFVNNISKSSLTI